MPQSQAGTETESSAASEATDTLDVENQAQPGDHENAAESSTAADGKETVSAEEWDPLSVVKKAIGEEPKSDEEGSDEGKGKQSDKSSKSENENQKPEGEDEPLGDVTDEELKSYKPKTRKRIEGLLDDRSRLTEQVTALQPQAEQMENLQTYMQEKNLTPKNVSELLLVGGLVMSDKPEDLRAALTRVNAFKTQIETQLGEVLPDDLQKKVDDGLLDAESAKEVALSRVQSQRAQVRVQSAETTVQTTQQTAQQQTEAAQKEVVHQTISDWQQQKASTDPDFSRKAELLQKEITLRVAAAGGRILDKDQAVKVADAAYAEVNRLFKAISPSKPLPAKKFTQSKAGPTNMAAKPNSALEAARAGLAKTS